MGFLEPDPTRAGQTRIPTHNTLWANTGHHTRAKFTVFKVDIAQNPDAWPLGGVRFYLDVHPSRLDYMMNRRVTFDMRAWEQNTPLTTLLPYVIQTFPTVVVALEPDRWLLQVQSAGYPPSRRWRSPDFTRSRHARQGHDASVQHGFQQVLCASGRRGDEHVGQGTTAQRNSYRIIGTLTV